MSSDKKETFEIRWNLEEELREIMSELDENEKLALAKANDLPDCIVEVLAADSSINVRNSISGNFS